MRLVAEALPRLLPVESSSIDAVGYDPDSHRLYVRFRSGRTYVYYDVVKRVFDDLLAADSKGRFLNAEIKGAYDYRRR